MNAGSGLLFAMALAAAAAMPGPSTAAAVARVLARGVGGAARLCIGLVLGELFWLLCAILGVAALAERHQGLFVAIRYADGVVMAGDRRATEGYSIAHRAIETVFKAIHDGDADPKLLAYQYLQMLPQIAQGESNKVWIIPSEFTAALGQLSSAIGSGGDGGDAPPRRVEPPPPAQ